MSLKIKFLGGAGTVTGSKFLVETESLRILVDCGLFQGIKELRLLNWAPFPVDPASIDFVLLTHAHLDHCGYLPLLVRNGFKGRIYCTPPTRDLARLILADSAKIQEEDAAYANRAGYSKHDPARPLYETKDVAPALKLFSTVRLGKWTELRPGTRFRLKNSGHILGSSFIELQHDGSRIVFSGDLGRARPLLLEPPDELSRADYIVVESTYGDRVHARETPLRALERVINESVARGGQLIIPSFAVGRVQDVLYLISQLKARRSIPDIPVFLDSPMGINATEIFAEYADWHRLGAREVKTLCGVATMVRSQQSSIELLKRRGPAIVIAGSGMCAGGRVLHHLGERLPDARNTVLLVGFQAAGTRGRLLHDGIPELKIHGRYVPVKAHIEEIAMLSAHADQTETLAWLKGFRKAPKCVFIVHGEAQASDALRVRITDSLGWACRIPRQNDEFTL